MKWTLVTGGARRLGAAICRTLASQGKNIAIHYHTSEQEAHTLEVELTTLGVSAKKVQGDFSTLQSCEAFMTHYLSHFADTESLIYNVGPFQLDSPATASPQALEKLFHINTLVPLLLSQKLLPSLKRQKGHLIYIGMAGADQNCGYTHAFSYDLTKHALALLTRSFAKELASHGVRVNMVSPGYLEESIDIPKSTPIPLGRVGCFTEVAEAVCYLLSSHYITGQNLEVAGGVRL
jgi:NAD(P)-dependent dehydrogenase (short-subunit alcohol dehydrogenase family)